MAALAVLLDMSGIGSERVWLRWVSSAEGKLFAEYAEQVSRAITDLGPFDRDKWRLPLAAIKRTLLTTRVRWLVGKELELEEYGNVYGEKMPPAQYQGVLRQVLRQEYDKALVLESLTGADSQQVKQIAEKTGLAIPTVASCLMELEHEGLAAVNGYDDGNPMMIRSAD